MLSKVTARQLLASVTHKSRTDTPVIFFGTSEVAWIGCKDVAAWEDGMHASFHNKGRKNKRFVVALEQVRAGAGQQARRTPNNSSSSPSSQQAACPRQARHRWRPAASAAGGDSLPARPAHRSSCTAAMRCADRLPLSHNRRRRLLRAPRTARNHRCATS